MADKKLTLVAIVKAKADKVNIVRKELDHLVVETNKEPGCINYYYHVNKEDETLFLFYENWRSRADWDKHMQMPYLRRWFDEVSGDLLEKEPELTLWEMVEPPAE